MPIAIVVQSDGTIPAVLMEPDTHALLNRLRGLTAAPPLASVGDAREWLSALAAPSGWFDTIDTARAHLAQLRQDATMPPAEFAAIRAALGLTRAAFGAALGYSGTEATRNKQVWEMEIGAKPIMPAKALRARSLAASLHLDEPRQVPPTGS